MQLEGKVALVTGATGTVGERLVHRLLAEGMQVRALVRRAGPFPGLPDAVELHQGDLSDGAAIERAMTGADLVVHSAAYIGSDWEQARAVNVAGTERMLRAALAQRPTLFLYLSTISVYDDTGEQQEITEESPLWQEGPHAYHHTKADAERLVWEAARQGLAISILRPGAILSPHPTSTWGPLAVKRLAAAESIRFHPEGILPWVHVENLVEMLVLAATNSAAVGQVYNAVDGHVSFTQFHGRIAAWLRREPDHLLDGRPPLAHHYVGAKIRTLGYSPLVGYEAAMVEIRKASQAMGLLPS